MPTLCRPSDSGKTSRCHHGWARRYSHSRPDRWPAACKGASKLFRLHVHDGSHLCESPKFPAIEFHALFLASTAPPVQHQHTILVCCFFTIWSSFVRIWSQFRKRRLHFMPCIQIRLLQEFGPLLMGTTLPGPVSAGLMLQSLGCHSSPAAVWCLHHTPTSNN